MASFFCSARYPGFVKRSMRKPSNSYPVMVSISENFVDFFSVKVCSSSLWQINVACVILMVWLYHGKQHEILSFKRYESSWNLVLFLALLFSYIDVFIVNSNRWAAYHYPIFLFFLCTTHQTYLDGTDLTPLSTTYWLLTWFLGWSLIWSLPWSILWSILWSLAW